MSFINLRSFQRDNPEYFEIRKECYKSNFRLIRKFMTFIYFAFFCAALAPVVAYQNSREMGSSVHIPTDLTLYPKAAYPWIIFLSWSCVSSALLGPNSCMFFGSLIGFLNNEFKILGISYSKIFMDVKHEIDDEAFFDIKRKLKANINYHVQLMK